MTESPFARRLRAAGLCPTSNHTRRAHSDNLLGPRWLALALLLHGILFAAARFWPQDEVPPARIEEAIQVSLIDANAPESDAPPAPAPPAPAPPSQTPAPRNKPRPQPEPQPEPTPTPTPEAPSEIPATEPVEQAAATATAPSTPPASESTTVGGGGNTATVADSNAVVASGGGGNTLVEASFKAAYLRNPKPGYPPASRRLREEGRVKLRVYVLADGSAGKIEILSSSGYARLDESASATVRKWRFVPGRRGDTAIDTWVVVPISFNLKES